MKVHGYRYPHTCRKIYPSSRVPNKYIRYDGIRCPLSVEIIVFLVCVYVMLHVCICATCYMFTYIGVVHVLRVHVPLYKGQINVFSCFAFYMWPHMYVQYFYFLYPGTGYYFCQKVNSKNGFFVCHRNNNTLSQSSPCPTPCP